MANNRVRFLRTHNLSTILDSDKLDFVPADGQPFYDAKSNMLFIGDGISKISDIKTHYEKTLNSNGAQKLINVDAAGNITNQSTTEGKLMYVEDGKVKNYNASGANNKNIGSGINPVYIANDGTVTASDSNIGSTNKPIYLKNGTITEISDNVGSSSKPVYLNAGTITQSNSNIGNNSKPIYMDQGELKVSNGTIGSTNKPIYMTGGELKAISDTVGGTNGNSTYPIYLNQGVITELTETLSNSITGNAATVTNGVYTTDFDTSNQTKFGSYIVEKKKRLFYNASGKSTSASNTSISINLSESVSSSDVIEIVYKQQITNGIKRLRFTGLAARITDFYYYSPNTSTQIHFFNAPLSISGTSMTVNRSSTKVISLPNTEGGTVTQTLKTDFDVTIYAVYKIIE